MTLIYFNLPLFLILGAPYSPHIYGVGVGFNLSRSGMTLRILVSRLRGKFLRVVGLWVWVDPQGIYLNSCGCLPPSGVPCELPFLGCFGAYFAVKGRGVKAVFQADLRGKMSAPCQFILLNNSNGGFMYRQCL